MKIWQAVVLGLLGVVVAGCRNDPSVALLERDNNRKQMEIYQLKCRVADLEEQINSGTPATPIEMGTPPAVINGPAMTRPPAPGGSRPGAAETIPAPLFGPPEGGHQEPTGPNLGPLNISPGTETAPGEVPKSLRGPGGSSRWLPQHSSAVQLTGGTIPIENRPIDNRVVWQVTLHPSLTGGMSSGAAGDEGLLVVVEPRDQAGNIVPLAGDTSVALIDPALKGEQARLARWDFASAETERMLHTGTEPGIHLRLPWHAAPEHDRLEVFVRYTTHDGRILQARRQIAVALAGAEPERPQPPPAVEPQRPVNRPQRPQWSPERQ